MAYRARKAWMAVLIATMFCWDSPGAAAGWEAGAKAGFDSNLGRSVDNGEGSAVLSGYGSYWKGHGAETRLDWTLGFSVQAAAYPSVSEVDFAGATVSPGLAYIVRPGWTVAVAPYLSGKVVRDSQQSAWAFGGRLDLSQRFASGLYLGEYYAYTDSRAKDDVYAFTEDAFGAYLGMRWTPRVFTEAGYEFSRGESFLSVSTTAPVAAGGGPGRGTRRYSTAFGEDVFKETVDAHAVSLSAGIDWTRSWFSTVNYTYRRWNGDGGSAESSSGFGGIGYRF
jgi:hypothetical protein